jgi:hypothetical protein
MTGQGQNHPITKVPIQCDQHALLGHGLRQNIRIVRPAQSNLAGAHYVVAFGAELTASSTRNIWSRNRRTTAQAGDRTVISECSTLCCAKRSAAWMSSRCNSG